jgi:RimJ/RimL family protein N-acetyltransferase
VEFRADSSNSVSRRAILALGATEEGLLRHCVLSAHAGPRDLAVFSIIAPEWPAVKARLEQRLAVRRAGP